MAMSTDKVKMCSWQDVNSQLLTWWPCPWTCHQSALVTIQAKTRELVSSLVIWAQSTTKDYIRAEHKLHSICKLFISQVIIPHVFHVFLAYLYSAGTQHGNLHSAGWLILFCRPTQEPVLATANTGKNWNRFLKNAGEWTRRVEISKEEITGSKRSMYGYILTNSRLERENVSHQMGL